ncbi:uncharacterized protein LOC108716785 [Xenopus laevis]|nr:uncharacterized protein LOC108716785 [Xenopus laevis]
MHQPGGRYKYSSYTVCPLPHSWEEWQELWDQQKFCNYNTFVGDPEEKFWSLYTSRFRYIGMNDTEERRDWLAELVYWELNIIRDYVGILQFEDRRREEMLAEPELGCCPFKGLAEAVASPSENPVCVESSGCVIPGMAEPERGCCISKVLAEDAASPSENPVCVKSSGCLIPWLAEPELGCCISKGLAEAPASPSENPVCVESSGCVISRLEELGKDCMEEKEEDIPSPKEQQLVKEDQMNTRQKSACLVSPSVIPSTFPRWRDPKLCDVSWARAPRKVGGNLKLKKRPGGKNFRNTLWGPLVTGVT